MRRLGIVAIALIALATTAAALGAVTRESYSYKASMNARQETPKPKAAAAAGGIFTATVTANGAKRTLKWKLTFHNLSGKAVGAHIHKGKPGVSGPVIVPLCGPCRSGASGTMTITKDAADAMEHGSAYVNVHTGKNLPGEIRGAVKLVVHL